MNVNKNLIYDVGMHKGEDTEYYLKKGFKVVAFEADPDLVSFCKVKFSDSIDCGDLVIVEGAIVDRNKVHNETIKFYKNKASSVWGTVVEEWSERNTKLGAESIVIEVPCIDFSSCLKTYGIPYYLKIDIEGMDVICLESLLDFESKPLYISIESEKVLYAQLIREFDLFEKLGYDSYQIIDQSRISLQKEPKDTREGNLLNYSFQSGSSGLFGSDYRTKWKNKKAALRSYKWIFFEYRLWGDHSKIRSWFVMKALRKILSRLLRRRIPGWYDTHARHSSIR